MEECFDPVVDLPNDLAALCLSFAGVDVLLGVAQLVSHAWRDAIDGGLPAVWHDVCTYDIELTDAHLAEIVQKSHGRILSFKAPAHLAIQSVEPMRSLCNLRCLDVYLGCSISPVLPHMPLLEKVCFTTMSEVTFPPLQFLRKASCVNCDAVTGIHNLLALASLKLWDSAVKDEHAWPGSLRRVSIRDSDPSSLLVDRIAALQKPVRLDTDWSFAYDYDTRTPLTHPPFDWLAGCNTLQRLNLRDYYGIIPLGVVFRAMANLRELKIEGSIATDQDLQNLAQLTNLQQLSLCYLYNVTSGGLCHLASLPNLTRLKVDGCYGVKEYTPLAQFGQLRELYIHGSGSSHLSLEEVQAIAQLQHLEVLTLGTSLADSCTVRHFCTIQPLREISMPMRYLVPARAFSSLPALRRLEKFSVGTIFDDEMVDILVQIPTLKYIEIREGLNKQVEAKLRDALPRLEHLACPVDR